MPAVYDKDQLKNFENSAKPGNIGNEPTDIPKKKGGSKLGSAAKDAAEKGVDKAAGTATKAGLAATGVGAAFSQFAGKAVEKIGVKRIVIIALAGVTSVFVLIILLFAMFVGTLKSLHFSEVLSLVGHAPTQLVMGNTFSDMVLNRTLLDDPAYAKMDSRNQVATSTSSSGVLGTNSDAINRTGGIADKMRQIDPDKINKIMLNDKGLGGWKIIKEGGKVVGYRLHKAEYRFDKFAQKLFDQNYDELSIDRKMAVQRAMAEKARYITDDVFNTGARTFRNPWFTSLRQSFGLRTNRPDEYLESLNGKKLADARIAEMQDNYNYISGVDLPTSTIPTIQTAATTTKSMMDEAGQSGQNVENKALRVRTALIAGIEKAGIIGGIDGFSQETQKQSSVGVLLVTIYCMIRDLVDKGGLEIGNLAMETRAQRFAHDVQTDADQLREHAGNGVHTGAANNLWDGNESVQGAEKSPLYREATLGPQNKRFADETTKQIPQAYLDPTATIELYKYMTKKVVNDCLPTGDKLDELCAKVFDIKDEDVKEAGKKVEENGGSEDTLKKVASMLGEMLLTRSGGYSNMKPLTTNEQVNYLLELMVANYAGAYFTGNEIGEDRYNSAAIATNYQNAAVGRGIAYGRLLHRFEADATKNVAWDSLKTKYDQGSLYERYFAIKNPFSLVGRMSAAIPTQGGSALYLVRHTIVKLAKMPLITVINSVGGVSKSLGLSSKALAEAPVPSQDKFTGYQVHAQLGEPATQYTLSKLHYGGVEQWGWSVPEMKLAREDPEFSVFGNEDWIMKNVKKGNTIEEKMASLDEKYGKCYAPVQQTADDVEYGKPCHEIFYNNPEKTEKTDNLGSEEAIHYRYQKLRYGVIDSMLDTEITEEGATVGSGDYTAACPIGEDQGIKEGYQDGKPSDVRICLVKGIEVSTTVAQNVSDMIDAAKTDGVTLSAPGGGFRTMDQQIGLWNDHCSPDYNGNPIPQGSGSCSPPTAWPGWSNHQMGLAIDFANCSSQSTECFKWLNANAKDYGFENYEPEPWHWSVDGG